MVWSYFFFFFFFFFFFWSHLDLINWFGVESKKSKSQSRRAFFSKKESFGNFLTFYFGGLNFQQSLALTFSFVNLTTHR